MFKTIRVGRFFGIELFVHWTLWPLLIYLLIGPLITGGLAGAFSVLSLLIVLFVSVYLHELGHALAAMQLGVRTKDIILLPIGGVARFEKSMFTARSELLISAAGPLVNLAIALATSVPVWIAGNIVHVLSASTFESSTLVQIVQINLILGLSNLLPALPLDGGRILRAFLSMRDGHLTATHIAARISRYIGFGLIMLAPFSSWVLAILGIFIILASLQELWSARFRDVLERSRREGNSPMSEVFREFASNAESTNSSRNARVNRSNEDDVVDAVEVRRLP